MKRYGNSSGKKKAAEEFLIDGADGRIIVETEFQKRERKKIKQEGGHERTVRQCFDGYLQSRYDEETETITREEFTEIEFTYDELPVLYRDILYNMIGFVFGLPGPSSDPTIDFYNRLIKDNAEYTRWHDKRRYFLKIEQEEGGLNRL